MNLKKHLDSVTLGSYVLAMLPNWVSIHAEGCRTAGSIARPKCFRTVAAEMNIARNRYSTLGVTEGQFKEVSMMAASRYFCALALAGAFGLSSTALAQDHDWGIYEDAEHGCRLDYPRALFSPDPEEPGEPQRFSGEDDSTYFRVMGARNSSKWTPADIKMKYLRADMPGDITYERTKSEFLVLSGYREEAIFYTKVAVSDDHHTACILDITYPRSRKKEFDRIVTRMSHSFEVAR